MVEFPPGKVCIVGSINMDLVVRAPRLPAPGETVSGDSYKTYPGGKGANQAVAAQRMGAQVSFIGAIGQDPHGVKVKAALEAENIDLTHLIVRENDPTGLGMITVAEGGENMIVVAPGANATMRAQDVRAASALIESSDCLLLQMEIPLAAVIEAASIARGAGVAVILNAAPARVLPAELIKLVDILIVNRVEAATLLGMEPNTDPGRMTLRLPALGVPTILLTLGAQGSILSNRGRPRRVPTPQVQAVDAVAAGDAFCGAFAACWRGIALKAKSPDEYTMVEQAALVASAAGALASTRQGAIPSLPLKDEVMALAATLKIGT